MNTLKYKGFIGNVAYSDEDKIFFGKIVGIDGLVNYEGKSVDELNRNFKEAVNDYIAFCKEEGLPLKKSYTGRFNVRISAETHAQIAELSQQRGISLNAFVKETLQKAVQ